MLDITQVGGAVAWDGTLDVAMSDTSDVAAGDWIKQENSDESLYFKVASIVLDSKAVILNPDSFAIPSGGAATAFRTEEGVRDEIMAASDLANAPESEDVTEAIAPPGTTRKTADVYSSATVQVGKKYRCDYVHRESPSSDEWGARTGMNESIA